ncbi:MAG: VOC family protein [Myxococcota bacterium]
MRMDHISLAVRSMAASMPYYSTLLSLLGFREAHPGVWEDSEGFTFQFFEADANTPGYARYGAGLNHLGFRAPSEEAVKDVRDRMAEAGFPVPAIQDLDGAKALFMKDPDGIRFEVTYYSPRAKVVDGSESVQARSTAAR